MSFTKTSIALIGMSLFVIISYQNCAEKYDPTAYNQTSTTPPPDDPLGPVITELRGNDQNFDSKSAASDIVDLQVVANDPGNHTPLSYQWFKDGNPITSATAQSPTLVLERDPKLLGGVYYVEVTNSVDIKTTSENLTIVFTQTLFTANCKKTVPFNGLEHTVDARAKGELIIAADGTKKYEFTELHLLVANKNGKTCGRTEAADGTVTIVPSNSRPERITRVGNIVSCYSDGSGAGVRGRLEVTSTQIKACVDNGTGSLPTTCVASATCTDKWVD